MGRRFRGEHTQKVDAKGRVSIPASFRKVIEQSDPDWVEGRAATLIIVYGAANPRVNRNFLECYTVEAMEQIDALIDKMPRGSEDRKIAEDFFSSKAEEVTVDGSGRLILQKKLRDKIGIDGDDMMVFKASGDTFQVWRETVYLAEQEQTMSRIYDALPEGTDPLSVLDKYQGL
ncbi:division/cell wall cluster transcriptional repressor MraZ [Pseudoruegeria sp. SK021]|uniref:division/cell wall cluster transcriptional repressor MraZ n=1 Tax=Pseudoruegeria sp. SK021 TaxID=1933035 RepID=UPI000A259E4C|nr:hypothetical protein [Pseudoruegeria sp. SK021]OSP55002.1 hypothetical protein BV911_10160 [Pseudoruegeria sp. SK021]